MRDPRTEIDWVTTEDAQRLFLERKVSAFLAFPPEPQEVLKSLSYNRWRTDNPENTLRFHALRLRDVGMIKSTPQEIVNRGSNFQFLKELKKELKA